MTLHFDIFKFFIFFYPSFISTKFTFINFRRSLRFKYVKNPAQENIDLLVRLERVLNRIYSRWLEKYGYL